ncbi:MAG: SLBB domain-containing protein, partial [Symbiobacteriaceae bacterium]|nr:SLBB domain-containing protein [Symbiobacteriaceae bacterium]
MPQLRSRDIFLLGLISGLILAAIGTFWWLDKNSVPATPYVTVLGGSALASAPPTEAVTVPPIVIYLVGAVRQPGVYTLPPTARLVDAIQLAGGFSDDADQEGVNLAMPLKDGLRYYLPRLGELEMAGVAAATGDASGMLTSGSGKININTAD